MLRLRKAGDRGRTDLGWLTSYHTFSFGGYQDPDHMGFRALRVLNDDTVAPGKGFGAHGHRDMEIISYVLDGTLAHKDSTTDEHLIGPNEIQAMSAGSGVIHSEFNGSQSNPVHFLQIWIAPASEDVVPSYQQIAYGAAEKQGALRLLAGPERTASTAFLHQDARMYATLLDDGQPVTHRLARGRHAWVHCATGAAVVNGTRLEAGDGLALSDESQLTLSGAGDGRNELLVFDLP